jgi:transposase
MQHIATLGIDAAKNIFHLHGVDAHGKVVLKKRLVRTKVLAFVAGLAPCLIGLEASGSAHHWAREFTKLGHTVQLISPQFVKPYVQGNKNDPKDAAGICEAVGRPHMRCVPIKSVDQQDMQALHRIRERQIKARTALVNQIRGLLAEYGVVIPKGVAQVRQKLPFILEEAENGLTMLAREWLQALAAELQALDQRIRETNTQMQRVFASHEACQRLAQLEGVGPLSATALVAAVGEATTFKNGREFAAWLGLVPRQHSTGGKPLLLGISKRGDRYLRKLLIHGARAVVRTVDGKQDGRSRWLQGLIGRRGKNRAGVAQANKTARVAWALLAKGERYRPAA